MDTYYHFDGRKWLSRQLLQNISLEKRMRAINMIVGWLVPSIIQSLASWGWFVNNPNAKINETDGSCVEKWLQSIRLLNGYDLGGVLNTIVTPTKCLHILFVGSHDVDPTHYLEKRWLLIRWHNQLVFIYDGEISCSEVWRIVNLSHIFASSSIGNALCSSYWLFDCTTYR